MKKDIPETYMGRFEGKSVTAYTLHNKNGLQVSVMNYGAAITRIITPDKNGIFGNVVTGFSTVDEYIQQGQYYFGAIAGRYCNRIAGARFSLDGKNYTLHPNNGKNSLHGGLKGFDKKYWTIDLLPATNALKCSYLSEDGEEGFPGNLQVIIVYTLTEDNSVQIDYHARTDAPTPVNLTNHSYFNLAAGASANILGHELMINASHYTVLDDENIPTGEIRSVAGSPLDFRKPHLIGENFLPGGYDHNYILDGNPAAILIDPASGRKMEMFSTEPGVQFFSGNFLQEVEVPGTEIKIQVRHSALCLEAQHFPNSPNEPAFPGTTLKPGETYAQTTRYRFSVTN